MNVTFLIRCQKYKRPPKILDLHSSFRATEHNSILKLYVMDICYVCNFSFRPRQEGLQCDGCYRWQHRTCDTRIPRAQYRAAVQSGEGIDWSCQVCMETPYFESTTMEEDMDSLINDPSMVSTCTYVYVT